MLTLVDTVKLELIVDICLLHLGVGRSVDCWATGQYDAIETIWNASCKILPAALAILMFGSGMYLYSRVNYMHFFWKY
jgi:hypothetical protein